MKPIKIILVSVFILFVVLLAWFAMLYRTYGLQTLLFLFQSNPEYLYTYSKNMVGSTNSPTMPPEELMVPTVNEQGEVVTVEPTAAPIAIPGSHMITTMSHTYQKMNNCGPSSASMAASTLGVVFDQFVAADVLKGSGSDKNVSAEEMVPFLQSQGLQAIYRVNGKAAQVERLVSQNIPVIVEQWLVKRGTGEHVGHYRVVRGYDQNKQIFTTNDSFNGPNFIIPYSQFEEWWRPFNRGYIVVYKAEQEQMVKNILGQDFDPVKNVQLAYEASKREVQSNPDAYAYFNVGSNAVLIKDYVAATAAYDTALTKTFPDHFLWYQFGPLEAYVEQGQYERVLQLTSTLLAQAGEMEEARYFRGLVYAKQGKTAEAKTEFEKALQANPRFQPAIRSLQQL